MVCNMVGITISLSQDVYRAVDRISQETGNKISSVIGDILEQYFGHKLVLIQDDILDLLLKKAQGKKEEIPNLINSILKESSL